MRIGILPGHPGNSFFQRGYQRTGQPGEKNRFVSPVYKSVEKLPGLI